MLRFRSDSVDVAYVKTFSESVMLLSQQKKSRLRHTVMHKSGVVGTSWTVERLGETRDAGRPVLDRHGDTPLDNTPHTRRTGFISDYDTADLLDKNDELRILIEPLNKYSILHSAVMGRTTDDLIIAALGGSTAEGNLGTTITAFPAAQQIASSSTGLTIAKLTEARELLDAAEVDEMWTRYFTVSAKMISQLLEDEKITSADYNTVKTLQAGGINSFMGFEFVRTQRLQVDGSSARLAYAYAQPAIQYAEPNPSSSRVDHRPDKRNARQVYTCMSAGAARAEDEMVVEVACTE